MVVLFYCLYCVNIVSGRHSRALRVCNLSIKHIPYIYLCVTHLFSVILLCGLCWGTLGVIFLQNTFTVATHLILNVALYIAVWLIHYLKTI